MHRKLHGSQNSSILTILSRGRNTYWCLNHVSCVVKTFDLDVSVGSSLNYPYRNMYL